MADRTKRTPELRITYARSANCRTVPVSGAWGGLTPNGNISFGLYQEYVAEPGPTIRRQDSPKETPEEEISRIPVIREIQSINIVDPDVAERIASWLNDQVKEFKRQQNAHEKK